MKYLWFRITLYTLLPTLCITQTCHLFSTNLTNDAIAIPSLLKASRLDILHMNAMIPLRMMKKRDMSKEFNEAGRKKKKEDAKFIEMISQFVDTSRYISDLFIYADILATTLPEKQMKNISEAYSRLTDEIFVLLQITYYLDEELKNKDIDLEKCYYHIDNFFHRTLVIEDMTYIITAIALLHSLDTDKEKIRGMLITFGYEKIGRFLENFTRKTKKVRRRRQKLVHRPGFSAKEQVRKVKILQAWDATVWGTKHKHSKVTELKYCKKEKEEMKAIAVNYMLFTKDYLNMVRCLLRKQK